MQCNPFRLPLSQRPLFQQVILFWGLSRPFAKLDGCILTGKKWLFLDGTPNNHHGSFKEHYDVTLLVGESRSLGGDVWAKETSWLNVGKEYQWCLLTRRADVGKSSDPPVWGHGAQRTPGIYLSVPCPNGTAIMVSLILNSCLKTSLFFFMIQSLFKKRVLLSRRELLCFPQST